MDDRRKSGGGARTASDASALGPAKHKQAHIVPLLLLSPVSLVLFVLKKYEVEWSLSCL